MRRLRNLLIVLPALVAVSGTATADDAADTVQSTLLMQVDGTVGVSAQGDVTDYRVDTTITPALQAMVDRAVRRWKFEPPLIAGTPHDVASKVRVVLTATKMGDGYAVKIDDVVFLNSLDPQTARLDGAMPLVTPKRTISAGRYPFDLLVGRKSATILVAVMLDGDGRVEKSAIVQSMMLSPRGPESVQADDLHTFEKSVLRDSANWNYIVPADFGQRKPEDRTGTVTVNFITNGVTDMAGKWCPVSRLPRHHIPWADDSPHAQKAGAAAVASGEMMPATSPLKLVASPVGAALH